MPYSIKKGTGVRKWKIINKDTGKQVGSALTKEKAKSIVMSMRVEDACARTNTMEENKDK